MERVWFLERNSLQIGKLESHWREFGFWREIVSTMGNWRFIGESVVSGER